MLAEFGHACTDYTNERFPIQTRSSLSDANTLILNLNKNYATKNQQYRFLKPKLARPLICQTVQPSKPLRAVPLRCVLAKCHGHRLKCSTPAFPVAYLKLQPLLKLSSPRLCSRFLSCLSVGCAMIHASFLSKETRLRPLGMLLSGQVYNSPLYPNSLRTIRCSCFQCSCSQP